MRKRRQHVQNCQRRSASSSAGRPNDGDETPMICRRLLRGGAQRRRGSVLASRREPLLLVVLCAALVLSASSLRPTTIGCSTQQRRSYQQHLHPLLLPRAASSTSVRRSASPPKLRSYYETRPTVLPASASSVASFEPSGAKRDVPDATSSPPPDRPAMDLQVTLSANDKSTLTNGFAAVGDAPRPVEPATPKKQLPFPLVLWKFSRPHTLIGSAIAIPALHFLAAPTLPAAFTAPTAASILYAMLPSLLMNIYITGLNQISDVEIDRINKPYLVLPAGIMSQRSAIATVTACLLLSLGLGHLPHPWATEGLAFALWGSAILGTMYSLKPFRLKRFPLLAAFCIVAVRGTIINASFFAHATAAAYGGSASVLGALLTSPRCLLSSLFYCVFGVVIALMKDVPDVRGDRSSRVRTFSVRLGQDRVFHWSRRLLTGLFWAFGAGLARSAIMTAVSAAQFQEVAMLCAGRALAAVAAFWAGQSVRRQSRGVDPNDPTQVYDYYMHLWKLFYGSYLALPIAR